MTPAARSSTRMAVTALFAADVISTAGSEITAVALPWFVLVTSGSPARMGAVLAAEFAGMALLGLVGGQAATVFGPRRTMLASDLARAGLVGVIPVLSWLGGLSLPVLLAIGLAVGAFFPGYSSSQRLVLAGIVGDDELRLTRANGLMGSINEVGSFVGPAVGGVLVVAVGPRNALLVDSLSYLCAFALIAILVPTSASTAPRDTADSRVWPALRYLFEHLPLRRTVIGIAFIEIGWTAMAVALPLIAAYTDDAHADHGSPVAGGAAVAGWLLAAYGGGSVIGGLASARARSTGDGVALRAVVVSAILSWLLLVSVAPWPGMPWPGVPWWISAAIVAGIGVCAGLFFPRFFASLTSRTPVELRARVMTAVTIATSAPAPIGFIGAGMLAQAGDSPAAAMILVGTATTIGAVIVIGATRQKVNTPRG